MKRVFMSLAGVSLAAALCSIVSAARTILEGTISDSMCGASHAKTMEMHRDAKMTDLDCTLPV